MIHYTWPTRPGALRALAYMGPSYRRKPGSRHRAAAVPRMASVKTLVALAQTGIEAAGPGSWYGSAALSILNRAGSPRDARYLAALCAAYSPRVHVVKANRMAYRFFLSGVHDPAAMPVHRLLAQRAATAYRAAEDPVLALAAPKVGPFAAALCGQPDALVLDVWMARALSVPERSVALPAVAAKAADRLDRVAEATGRSMADTQAAVWLGSALAAGRLLPSLGWRW
jgi:hypothetical protein